MRRLALILLLLLSPFVVLAAERATQAEAPVAFQDEDGEEDAAPTKPDLNKLELPPAEDAPGGEFVSEDSNAKLVLPPGWVVGNEGGDADGIFRFGLERHVQRSDGIYAIVLLWRFERSDPTFFERMTPGDALDTYERLKFFERWYGEDSAGRIPPDVNGGEYLGGLSGKSAGFTYRGIQPEETQKLREVEELIRRGDKNAVLPDYPDIVIRGRIGMISPYVYVLMSHTSRGFGDHPALTAEIQQIFESFQFLESEAKAPALIVAGEEIGDTFADEALKKERKVEIPHTGKQPRKTYEIEVNFKLPPGWTHIDDDARLGEQISAIVFAQDADHNWIRITLQHVCFRESQMQNTVDQDCESFKTNWQGRATRTDIPRDLEKVSIGSIRGKGYRGMTGYIGQFPARFQGLITDDGGWRHIITVESLGDFGVFEKDLKKWERSLRIRD